MALPESSNRISTLPLVLGADLGLGAVKLGWLTVG